MLKGIIGLLVVGFVLMVALPKLFPINPPTVTEDPDPPVTTEEWRDQTKRQLRAIVNQWKIQKKGGREIARSSEDGNVIGFGESILPSQRSGWGLGLAHCRQNNCSGAGYSYISSYDPLVICFVSVPLSNYTTRCSAPKGCCSPNGWNMMAAQQTYGY